jgi:pyruvate dehydrogenase phosphatase
VAASRTITPIPVRESGQGLIDQATSGKVSSDVVTERLHAETSIFKDGSSPVTSCHIARVASTSPCEDRYVRQQLSAAAGLLKEPWHAWGVFDGHSGSQTAELLTKQLIPYVQDALGALSGGSSDDSIEASIKKAFLSLDNTIVHGAAAAVRSGAPYHEQLVKLMPAYTGSCALLSLLDPKTWTLRVACVGDSRAVLGHQDAEGNWSAKALSVDQTGSNEAEIERINAGHPGENGIVKAGRVLGIMVSRGFGDGRWKWDLDLQQEIKDKYDGFNPLSPERYPVKTPPYLTAEPVVTTTQLDDARPSFLIMASDGFWDRVSNQQAVDLVSGWLKWRAQDSARQRPSGQHGMLAAATQHGPFRMDKHRQGEPGFLFTEERTSLQDANVAVHLVRNALGGNFQEMLVTGLAVEPPFSRYMRDDITVQVIFFDPKNLSRSG